MTEVMRRRNVPESLSRGSLILALAILSTACSGEGTTTTPVQVSSTAAGTAGTDFDVDRFPYDHHRISNHDLFCCDA